MRAKTYSLNNVMGYSSLLRDHTYSLISVLKQIMYTNCTDSSSHMPNTLFHFKYHWPIYNKNYVQVFDFIHVILTFTMSSCMIYVNKRWTELFRIYIAWDQIVLDYY